MKAVIALAGLLVAALIGLVLWLRTNGEHTSTSSPPSSPAPRLAPAPSPTSSSPAAVSTDGTVAPLAAPDKPRTYVVGNVHVREHRPDAEPMTEPPDFTPPEGIHLSSEFAQQVTNLMAPPAKQCLRGMAAELRTDDTKLNVTMTVAVKAGALTVTGVAAAVRGVDDPAMAPTLECLRSQMIGRSVDATGQPDVASYLISTYYTSQ